MVDVFISIVQSLGFPIFVAVYLMVYNRKALLNLTIAIEKLSNLIEMSTPRTKHSKKDK